MLRSINADTGITNIRKVMRDNGFVVKTIGDQTFAINIRSKNIVNLTELGFDISEIQKIHRQQQLADIRNGQHHRCNKKGKSESGVGAHRYRDVGGGSHTDNREWEVGNNGDYDSIEESKRLKM